MLVQYLLELQAATTGETCFLVTKLSLLVRAPKRYSVL